MAQPFAIHFCRLGIDGIVVDNDLKQPLRHSVGRYLVAVGKVSEKRKRLLVALKMNVIFIHASAYSAFDNRVGGDEINYPGYKP